MSKIPLCKNISSFLLFPKKEAILQQIVSSKANIFSVSSNSLMVIKIYKILKDNFLFSLFSKEDKIINSSFDV